MTLSHIMYHISQCSAVWGATCMSRRRMCSRGAHCSRQRCVHWSSPSPVVWLEEWREKERNIWCTVALAQPPEAPLLSSPLLSSPLLSSPLLFPPSFPLFLHHWRASLWRHHSFKLQLVIQREVVAYDPLMSMSMDPANRHADTTKCKYRPAGLWLCVCLGFFFVCELTVTNTGGMQTKSTAIIVVSRGQGQFTTVVEHYAPIN